MFTNCVCLMFGHMNIIDWNISIVMHHNYVPGRPRDMLFPLFVQRVANSWPFWQQSLAHSRHRSVYFLCWWVNTVVNVTDKWSLWWWIRSFRDVIQYFSKNSNWMIGTKSFSPSYRRWPSLVPDGRHLEVAEQLPRVQPPARRVAGGRRIWRALRELQLRQHVPRWAQSSKTALQIRPPPPPPHTHSYRIRLGYLSTFPITWTPYLGKISPYLGNHCKKKKKKNFPGLSREFFSRQTPQKYPLSRENGNTHAALYAFVWRWGRIWTRACIGLARSVPNSNFHNWPDHILSVNICQFWSNLSSLIRLMLPKPGL